MVEGYRGEFIPVAALVLVGLGQGCGGEASGGGEEDGKGVEMHFCW